MSWRYENYGSAKLLATSGTTQTNLPKTQSKYMSAFNQTAQVKCFDIPASYEIWFKFDVYVTNSNAYVRFGSVGSSIYGYATSLGYVRISGINVDDIDAIFPTNQLNTFLIHANSAAGILEIWLNNLQILNFSGAFDEGGIIDDLFLSADEGNAWFSNVIISDGEIGLNESVRMPLNTLCTAERDISNRNIPVPVKFSAHAVRDILNDAVEFRYENYGSAKLITTNGVTLTDLPTSQSKTGSAFRQYSRSNVFNLPRTKEIWIKFDVYFSQKCQSLFFGSSDGDGTNQVRLNITGSSNDYNRIVFAQSTLVKEDKTNQLFTARLYSIVLHMISNATSGKIELSISDGKTLYYSGNVNSGNAFENVYIQPSYYDDIGTYPHISNVIISNRAVSLSEMVKPIGYRYSWFFSGERTVSNEPYLPRMNAATKVLLHFDDDADPFKDECFNHWTAHSTPTIGKDNAKFGKALQLYSFWQYWATHDENSVDDICFYKFLSMDEKITLGGRDFTIDFWAYTGKEVFNDAFVFYMRMKAYIDFVSFFFDVSKNRMVLYKPVDLSTLSNDMHRNESATFINTGLDTRGELHHFEIVYRYKVQRFILFVDGNIVNTAENVCQYPRSEFQLFIGAGKYSVDDPSVSSLEFFRGAIDEFRIVDGFALHTSNFTPPTAPYSLFPLLVEFETDAERQINQPIKYHADALRNVCRSTNFGIDLERWVAQIFIAFKINPLRFVTRTAKFSADLIRALAQRLTDESALQSIQIEISAQQLTDRVSFATPEEIQILQQIRGRYLDYDFDLRVEELNQQGVITNCHCCSDIDELLYTQISYTVNRRNWQDGRWVYADETASMVESPNAKASVHLQHLAGILGKNLKMQFADFISTVNIEQAGVTYNDLIRDIFGWTARVPTLLINCYLRNDTLHVIQRGYEENVIDLAAAKCTVPVIKKNLVRTLWGTTPESFKETYWEFILGNPMPEDDTEPEPKKTARTLPRTVTKNENGIQTTIHYEYDADDNVTLTETITRGADVNERVVVQNEYVKINGRKFLSAEITTEYSGGEMVSSKVVNHEYLTQGQQHISSVDSEGNILGSQSAAARAEDRPTAYNDKKYIKNVDGFPFEGDGQGLYTYVNGRKIEVIGARQTTRDLPGILLYDSSFPISGEETLKSIDAAVRGLNRKTQETISLDVYDFPHVIDFNDRIIFNGAEYFLEKNTAIKNARTVNKQSLQFVRWY